MQQISFTRNVKRCKNIFQYWRPERKALDF